MGFLERLENFIQGAVEGSASSALRVKIKPVEIENELERSMRDRSVPSQGARLAPNTFTVRLHPDTFRETISPLEGYNTHCEALLHQFANQQGYKLLHRQISVAFDTDDSLGRRDIEVDAAFEAPQNASSAQYAPPASTHVPPNDNHLHTRVMHPSRPAPQQQQSSLWGLQVIHGPGSHQVYAIPMGEVTVGRSRDCHIYLRDDSNTVSRQHAVFINNGYDLHLRDTDSTNGTKVNGNYIPSRIDTRITDGAEISFGPYVLRARMERDQER